MKLPRSDVKKVSRLLKSLSNETRLSILCLLSESSKTVTELMELMEAGNHSAISQHLQILRKMGLVKSQRRGQSMEYHLVGEEILPLMEFLKQQYCGGQHEK